MESFAYQLGQLCSAMDELHIGYCKGMRKGDIPTILVGNSIYKMALQNSSKALGMLASRCIPYDSWAKRERAKVEKIADISDKAIQAGIFAYLWMGKQADCIAEKFKEKNSTTNDTYKTELMLGYLAGRPFKKEEKENNTEGAKK